MGAHASDRLIDCVEAVSDELVRGLLGSYACVDR